MKTKRIIAVLLSLVIILTGLIAFTACVVEEQEQPKFSAVFNKSGIFDDFDFVSAIGSELRTDCGNGEKLTFRGTNAGGLLLLEQWMTAIINAEGEPSLDHKTVSETFTSRFGKEGSMLLWEHYRNNFWTDKDFQNCKDMGMNVIRLPFSYMNVDPEFNNIPKIPGQKYNFTLLDNFIEGAAKKGIYTMLDLHGAYGSQNGKDHSGEIVSNVNDIDFYSNEEKQQKTIDLWKAVASRYKDNPAVCGYDILNEPGENAGTTTTRHWVFFDKVYDAIREVDENHVIIIESCWGGENLPKPSVYGWTNIMYSFHHYTGQTSSTGVAAHLASMQSRINNVKSMNFNVPIHMGEFSCYGNEESWTGTLKMLTDAGWSWNTWTYKLNRTNNTSNAGWGIYYSKAQRVVPSTDTFMGIMQKWVNVRTDNAEVRPQTFSSGTTLVEIMTEACTYIP